MNKLKSIQVIGMDKIALIFSLIFSSFSFLDLIILFIFVSVVKNWIGFFIGLNLSTITMFFMIYHSSPLPASTPRNSLTSFGMVVWNLLVIFVSCIVLLVILLIY